MVVVVSYRYAALLAVDGVLDIREAAGKVVGKIEVEVVKLETVAEDCEGTVGMEDDLVKELLSGGRTGTVTADGDHLIVNECLADELAIEIFSGLFGVGVDVGVHDVSVLG